MKRVYVPYGFDWRDGNDAPDQTAHCWPCNSEFRTKHEIRNVDDELVQYFSHICPGCDSLDGVRRVSSDPETMTLHG